MSPSCLHLRYIHRDKYTDSRTNSILYQKTTWNYPLLGDFYSALKYISHAHRWSFDTSYSVGETDTDQHSIKAKIELRKIKKKKLKLLMARFVRSIAQRIPEYKEISKQQIDKNIDESDTIGSLYVYAQFEFMFTSCIDTKLGWELLKLERLPEVLYCQSRINVEGLRIDGKSTGRIYIISEVILIDGGDSIYYILIESPSLEPYDRSTFQDAVGQWLSVTRIFKK